MTPTLEELTAAGKVRQMALEAVREIVRREGMTGLVSVGRIMFSGLGGVPMVELNSHQRLWRYRPGSRRDLKFTSVEYDEASIMAALAEAKEPKHQPKPEGE